MRLRVPTAVGLCLMIVVLAFSAQFALGAPAPALAASLGGCPEHAPPSPSPEPAGHQCCDAGHQAALPTTESPRLAIQATVAVGLAQQAPTLRSHQPVCRVLAESHGPPLASSPLRV